MNPIAGLIVALVSFLWVFLEAEVARRDGMLTAAQMKKKYPEYKVGLPFLYHFGMWGDLFIITPLVYWLVSTYSVQWTLNEMIALGAIGLVLSVLFHWFYTLTPFPDSLTWKHEITRAGWLHVIYTAAGVAIIGLGLFATEQIAVSALIFLALATAIHSTLSGKIFLGLLNKFVLRYDWLPMMLKQPDQWFAVVFPYIALATIVFLRI